jgi:hypothetical protein
LGFHLPGRVAAPAPRAAVRDGQLLTMSRTRAAVAPVTWMRIGKVRARSAARYFFVWTAVLFLAQVVVMTLTYAVLTVMGVTGSVSRAIAVLGDEQLPSSGIVPALQPAHVLPMILVAALLLSLLFLVAAVGVVLVHNATTTLTGGLAVRVRPEPRGR